PAAAAVVTRSFFYAPRFSDARLRLGRWSDYARFWAVSLAVVALSFAAYTALGAVRWDPSGRTFLSQLAEQMAAAGQNINDLPAGLSPQRMLLIYAVGGLTVFNVVPGMLTGFGECFGWRDLAFPLLYRVRPWAGFVVGGLLWFAWHLPVAFVLPQSQAFTPAEQAINLLVLAVGAVCTFTYLAYVYARSGSVFVVSLAHIVLDNASRSVSYYVVLDNQLLANLGLTLSSAAVVAILHLRGDLRTLKLSP
ncbi:MAG TPA: CPBP family glutamic-type intramembrane protease, partial [Chloroflexota bacterium]|nr:CPBP family glutamic-type intramembrane protease [Chloroflexota bacterium]